MSEKLKPCPFCGSEAELRSLTYKGGKLYGVFCTEDLARTHQHGHFIDNYNSIQEAINAWNRRGSDE